MSGVVDTEREAEVRPPWGYDAHTALRWAYNRMDRRETFNANIMARMIPGKGATGARQELSPLELAAQAAIIRECVMRIADPHVVSFIVAYYLPRPAWERQPGGEPRLMKDRWLNERTPHIDGLAWWLMGQAGTGMHRIRGYRELVAQYIYGQSSIRRIKAMVKCGQERAAELGEDTNTKLRDLKARSITMAQGKLEQEGWL